MTSEKTHLVEILETDSGVDAGYRHGPKRVTPGEPLETSKAVFKWYGLHPEDRPIPEDLTNLARSALTTGSLEVSGLGFVVLHRCGADFYFLIVCTWRNSNEIWQTVFYKEGDAMPDFKLWPREESHKPMLCVWELVPVWHEQQAWERFLLSSRDEAAAQAWMADRFAGPA